MEERLRRRSRPRKGEGIEDDIDRAIVQNSRTARLHKDALHGQLQPVQHLDNRRHTQRAVLRILQDELRLRELFQDASPHLQCLLVDAHEVLRHSEGQRCICRTFRDRRTAQGIIRRIAQRMRQAQRLLAVELLRPRRREQLIRQERIDEGHPRRRGGIQPRHLYGRRAQREHGERRPALPMPAEVNQDIDLIRTDALRLLLRRPLREYGSMNARRLP